MPDIALKASEKNTVITAVALLFASVFAAMLTKEPLFCLAPVGFLIGYQLLIDFKPVFFLLLFVTPLSIEYSLSNSLSIDLPTEPLEIILMFTFIFYVLLKKENFDKRLLRHPITIILLIQIIWILLVTIFSQDVAISLKYLLAKLWYITTFYFVASQIFKKPSDFKTAFWCLFAATLFVVIYTLTRHSQSNFSFSTVNTTMFPYFRNHVNYAVYLSLFLPFTFWAASWYKKYTWQRMLINFGKIIVLVAIYFAYTRSAWISVTAIAFCYFLIRYGKLMWSVAAALIAVIVFIVYMFHDNRFLDYAPDYQKTIYHANLSDHLQSTTSLTDVSSAERIYRWLAGVNMIKARPVFGFGPEGFYNNYKEYTINKFTTYISDNEERSTIHNYYLLVTVEQGFPGLIILLSLIITFLYTAQKLYRQADAETKKYIMAISLSYISILVNISLSDLLEADKIGTLFFMNMALLVNVEFYLRDKQKAGIAVY